jgi:hypothetical protein
MLSGSAAIWHLGGRHNNPLHTFIKVRLGRPIDEYHHNPDHSEAKPNRI